MCADERGRTPVAPPSFGMTWGGLPVNGGCSTTVAVATALTVGVARPAVAQQSVAHLGCSLGWA
jgi:hypothetical protein